MAGVSPERRARIEKRVWKTLEQMRLKDVREARKLSQTAMARKLKVRQPAIAKLEKRGDMYLSTLRDYIRATGGEMQIIARFPEGAVEIRPLGD
jgi:transcriptional regulator with XRE-family HTH domain